MTSRTKNKLDLFIDQYIQTALWSSTGFDPDSPGSDEDVSLEGFELSSEAHELLAEQAKTFYRMYRDEWIEMMDDEQAAHYFWLSSAGHGVGFFEYQLTELQDASETFRSELYIGDDGLVHVS